MTGSLWNGAPFLMCPGTNAPFLSLLWPISELPEATGWCLNSSFLILKVLPFILIMKNFPNLTKSLHKILLFFPPQILCSHLNNPTLFPLRTAQSHPEAFVNDIPNWSVYLSSPFHIYIYLYFKVYLIEASSREPCLFTEKKNFLHPLKPQSMFICEHHIFDSWSGTPLLCNVNSLHNRKVCPCVCVYIAVRHPKFLVSRGYLLILHSSQASHLQRVLDIFQFCNFS